MRDTFYKLTLASVFAITIAGDFSLWQQTKEEEVFAYLKPLAQTATEPQVIQTEDETLRTIVTQAASKSAEPKNLVSESVTAPPSLPPAFRIPILMYHYIGDNPNPSDTTRNSLTVSLKNFEEQMQYLTQNGFTALSLEALADIAAKKVATPTKPVVLTFDDGYIDFYVNASPILKKHDLRAVVFISTGLMNQGYYMSWDQIREISNSGLVSFGAHTVTHRYLIGLNRYEVFVELRNSKEVLESKIGQKVNFVSYPFGASNNLICQIAQEVGFVGGVGTWSGVATNLTMNMPRLRMGSYVTLDFFASLLK